MARKEIAGILHEGDTAVDATAGKGRDTLFLARLVGSCGEVYAFDIQQDALDRTAALLKQNKVAQKVVLIRAGHEAMLAYIEKPVAAVMFNLGYLPGGDHSIVTRPENVVQGLAAALRLLKPGGLVTLVLYPGHGPGEREKAVLLEYCRRLDGARFGVIHTQIINRSSFPPELLVVKNNLRHKAGAPGCAAGRGLGAVRKIILRGRAGG